MALFDKKNYNALLERIEQLEPRNVIQYNQATEFYQWYFWKQSSSKIKRVHSGLPRTIINILSIVTGIPEIQFDDEERLNNHLEYNNFIDYLKQEIRPRTLATGYGAIFPNFINDNLIIEFIDARNCTIERVGNVIISVTKITTYEKYRLEEKRFFNTIEYRLFDKKGNQVSLAVLKETIQMYMQAKEDNTLVGDTIFQNIPIDMIPAVPLSRRHWIRVQHIYRENRFI